jgi:hypothetical protein
MARVCTCGFTEFYRVQGVEELAYAESWIEVDLGLVPGGIGKGYGATPYGTEYGAGTADDNPGDGWSLVRSPFQGRTEQYRCNNCDRVRTSTITGGTALFGGYYDAITDIFCFVVSGVEDLALYQARVVAQTEAVDFLTPIFVDAGPAEVAVPVNVVLQSQYLLPPGAATAQGLFCTGVLGLTEADTYDIYLSNTLAGTQEFAGNFVFTP